MTRFAGFIVNAFVNDKILFLETLIPTVKIYSCKNCRFLQMWTYSSPEWKCRDLLEIENTTTLCRLWSSSISLVFFSSELHFGDNVQFKFTPSAAAHEPLESIGWHVGLPTSHACDLSRYVAKKLEVEWGLSTQINNCLYPFKLFDPLATPLDLGPFCSETWML